MFWDRVAFVYDIFADVINAKTHRKLCAVVADEIDGDDDVLECACGTGLLTKVIAERCRTLIAEDYSSAMLRKAKKNCRAYGNIAFREGNILDIDAADESFDKVIAGNVIHLLDEPYRALSELDRVCRVGGEIIIPTYMNRNSKGRTSGFAGAVGKAGADFKRQFTYESYQEFFAAAGYKDVKYTMIEGRVPCAVAVIRKGEHAAKAERPGESRLCAEERDRGRFSVCYQTQISDARWIAYDIPGNLGWIAYFTGLGMSVYRGDLKYAAITAAPAALMATGIAELIDERTKGLDRTLPRRRLLRGFGALTLGGMAGAAAAGVGATECSDKRIAAGMCAGGTVCAAFAGLLLKGYKRNHADERTGI